MIPYIINVAMILAGCLAFYMILLRRETFYRVNRYVLILCLLVAFALPLWRVPQQLSFRNTSNNPSLNYNPGLIAVDPSESTTTPVKQNVQTPTIATDRPATTVADKNVKQTTTSKFSFSQVMTWLVWIYWFGVIVFAFNFLLQAALLLWRAYRSPAIIDGRYRIVEMQGDKAPCSFGNNIFINPEKYDWETYNQILLHEKVHIHQRHSVDILLAELALIFQWFNPFAWIYRRQIESNLEFLTDNQLTEHNKVEKTSYQLSLLKVSAPHFPMSLTTNYNQSILKKRIAMMNSKKSNFHTAWKYFFLLPVLALFACLLNEPKAQSNPKEKSEVKEKKNRHHDMETEGSWFATIKNDKVNIQFASDDEDLDKSGDEFSGHSYHTTTFKLSELPELPKGAAGTFRITREAGVMELTGKFENNTGMGHYKFIADKAYQSTMNTELKETMDDRDIMVFFFINITKDYVQMLKKEGYTEIDKDKVIPLAALHVDAAYIKSLKESGFKKIDLDDLIPLKALGINGDYIKEIRSAGYENVTADQLVTFKSQGIDKEYIQKMQKAMPNGKSDGKVDADDIVTYKALGITEEFANSFKAVGYTNISHDDLVPMKSLGITPEFIKGFQDIGYKNIDISEEIIPLKSLGITPEYIKSFQDMGFKNIRLSEIIPIKSQNITPEYIRSFQNIGYKDVDLEDLVPLKSLGITPEFIKGFEAVGFKNIPLEEIVSVKAVGVTPEYVTSMKEKGFVYNRLEKYVTLKSIQ